MRRSITETMGQVGINLSSKPQTIVNDGTEIAYNDLVQTTLVNYNSLSTHELNRIENELSEYINRKYIFNNYVAEIIIYTQRIR